MILYDYIKEDTEFKISPLCLKDKINNNSLLAYSLSYKSPYVSNSEINDSVYAELFFKKEFFTKTPGGETPDFMNTDAKYIKYYNKNIPLLIFLHGFSTKNEKLDNYYKFINNILGLDMSCLFINLPFHLNRKPEGETSGSRIIYFDDTDTLLFFHQCVVDIRKAIDIIEKTISPKEINICGISLGSIVSVISMAVDKRINKGVLVVGGGNWEEIHWGGISRFILKGNCSGSEAVSRKKCGIFYSNFPEFLEKARSLNPESFTTEIDNNENLKKLCTKKCYLCDPMLFAHKINPKKVLMLNSRMDHYFSKKSSIMLWEELGKPEIHWFNYLHFSGILNKKLILKNIALFLKKK
ncbi:MAG: alpha/beta hydrolase family protein [Candidatus Humimicrobiaceae bacterium]